MVPPDAGVFGYSVVFVRSKGSAELIMPILEAVGHPIDKNDLYLIAEAMQPEDIHPEVGRKLDRMAEVLDRLNRSGRGPADLHVRVRRKPLRLAME